MQKIRLENWYIDWAYLKKLPPKQSSLFIYYISVPPLFGKLLRARSHRFFNWQRETFCLKYQEVMRRGLEGPLAPFGNSPLLFIKKNLTLTILITFYIISITFNCYSNKIKKKLIKKKSTFHTKHFYLFFFLTLTNLCPLNSNDEC